MQVPKLNIRLFISIISRFCLSFSTIFVFYFFSLAFLSYIPESALPLSKILIYPAFLVSIMFPIGFIIDAYLWHDDTDRYGNSYNWRQKIKLRNFLSGFSFIMLLVGTSELFQQLGIYWGLFFVLICMVCFLKFVLDGYALAKR